jgi:hypothetical protein
LEKFLNLEEDKNNLKEQILALSSIYTKKRLQTKFIKGETYIPASGSTLEEEEVANVIESVLSGMGNGRRLLQEVFERS